MTTVTLDRDPSIPLANNPHLLRWVEKMRHLTSPAAVHWVDGSQAEYDALCAQMVETGTLTQAQREAVAGLLSTRAPMRRDVARVEQRTFVCSLSKDAAGPTNNWVNPFEMRKTLRGLFKGCMAGPHDVRAGLQHGRSRVADVADRRPAHRLALRRRQHAHHGAHRAAGARGDRPRHQARRAVHAQRRHAAAAWRRRTCRGRATTRSTSSTSRRRARSGPTARATAATPCSARSASGCASRRRWRATKAGWPSTC